MDPVELRKLLTDLVKDPSLTMRPDGTTFCNFGVQRVVKAFGLDFDGLMANDIYDRLAESVGKDWLKVAGQQASDRAQRGGLAIAAKKYAVHGHVAVLFPAPMTVSESLGREVPQIANVGKKNAVMRVTEAFPVKEGEPDYFIYVG